MQKLYLRSLTLVLIFLNGYELWGQQFTPKENVESPFKKLLNSNAVYADFNNDGHEDVLHMGLSNQGKAEADIYWNQGKKAYSRSTVPFPLTLQFPKIAAADINQDGYTDVLVTGLDSLDQPRTCIVWNDSAGLSFTPDFDHQIPGLSEPEIILAKIDQNNSPDLVITGLDSSGTWQILQYLNTNGNFGEPVFQNQSLDKTEFLEIADINNDGYPDLFLGGFEKKQYSEYYQDYDIIQKLYYGDASGHYTESRMNTNAFPRFSNIAFGDLDQDGDVDVVASGLIEKRPVKQTLDLYTKNSVYLNDGTGHFSTAETQLPRFITQELYLTDLNGDSLPDLIMDGAYDYYGAQGKVLINQGNGDFKDSGALEFGPYRRLRFIVPENFLRNNQQILVLSDFYGNEQTGNALLYTFDSTRGLKKESDLYLPEINNSSALTIDLENDGDLDLISFGYAEDFSSRKTRFHINDGQGRFKTEFNRGIEDFFVGSGLVKDLDNDGDQDLILLGRSILNFGAPFDSGVGVYIYLNNGEGYFKADTQQEIHGYNTNQIQFWKNHLGQDIIALREIDRFVRNDSSYTITQAGHNEFIHYHIQSDGTFTQLDSGQVDLSQMDFPYFKDVNDDGRSDIYSFGPSGFLIKFQSGSGFDSTLHSFPFKASFRPFFLDVDEDQKTDLINGLNGKVYHLSNDQFVEDKKIRLPSANVYAAGDLDGDGMNEIMTIKNIGEPEIRLFHHNANGKPIETNSDEFRNFQILKYIFADFNGDLHTDIFFFGRDEDYTAMNSLYINTGCKPELITNNIKACDHYTFENGETHFISKSFTEYMKTVTGCDSIINTELTIDYKTYGKDIVEAVGEFTWINDSTYYQSTNNAGYILKNQAGCDSIVNLYLTLIPLSAEKDPEINLYPNPTGQILNLNLGHQPETEVHFRIIGSNGVLRRKWKSNEQSQSIDISGLEAGSYILKLAESDTKTGLRFVKR